MCFLWLSRPLHKHYLRHFPHLDTPIVTHLGTPIVTDLDYPQPRRD